MFKLLSRLWKRLLYSISHSDTWGIILFITIIVAIVIFGAWLYGFVFVLILKILGFEPAVKGFWQLVGVGILLSILLGK